MLVTHLQLVQWTNLSNNVTVKLIQKGNKSSFHLHWRIITPSQETRATCIRPLLDKNSQILLMFAFRSEKLLIVRGVSSSLSATTVRSYPVFRNMPRQKKSPIPPNVRTGRFNHRALILITHRLTSRKRLKPRTTPANSEFRSLDTRQLE